MALAPDVPQLSFNLFAALKVWRRPTVQMPAQIEDVRTDDRRAFLLEKLEQSPEACGSEAEFCQMMYLYPGRF